MSKDPVQVIADSPLFDAGWYQETYPDVQAYPKGAAHHYVVYGARLHRDPGPDFSGTGYLRQHVDVRTAGHNPLWHYELFGRAEGRPILPSRWAGTWADPVLAASLIDRGAGRADTAAQPVLRRIFEARLAGAPRRILQDFDSAEARRAVDALSVQPDAARAVRNTLVSVVMPSHNRADRMGPAVRSVLGQSHQNLELILVDDGSDDLTADLAAQLARDPRLVYLRRPRRGVSAARNAGLAQARGAVIFYLDTDNLWTRDFVRLMLIALRLSGARCGYAASQMRAGDGRVLGYRGEPFDWSHCVNGNYVDLNVFCHDRALYKRYGGFDTSLRRMVDWDLMLRMTRACQPLFCPFVGCLYSDDSADGSRISNATPYVFERLVSHRHALGFESMAEAARDLSLSIAIKTGVQDDLAEDLATALRQAGHRARLDGPEDWHARHPHLDEVVVSLPSAAGFAPHREQLSLCCGDDGQAGFHARLMLTDPERMARGIRARILGYLLGNPSVT